MEFWNYSAEKTLEELGVSASGLNAADASVRLAKYGENALKGEKQKSLAQIFIEQFKDLLVLILIVASIVSMALGEMLDGFIIIAIVVINSVIGAMQENRASNALNALKEMASPLAKILRDGDIIKVKTTQIVPGDIVVLEMGDYVPADLRLIESMNLKVDESTLTGESVSVEKRYETIVEKGSGIGDRINCCFSGTIVTYGRGRAVAVKTGMETEIGKIAKILSSSEDERTPLQKRLDSLGKTLGIMCLAICGLMFVAGLLRGYEWLAMFMNAVSLAVAAIPEGLTVVVTVVLARGMQKMVKRHAIIKRLSAVETLGSTTVICSDKTGTLTQNKMTVVSVTDGRSIWDVTGTGYNKNGGFAPKSGAGDLTDGMRLFMRGAILCNDADFREENNSIVGDPTEGALVVLGYKANLNKPDLNAKFKRINEVPFDSDRKLMTTFHKDADKIVAFTKGAPDVVLARSNYILRDAGITPLSDACRDDIANANAAYAGDALRVLAVAVKYHDVMPDDVAREENDLVFLGLAGMIDPPREEVKEAVAVCEKAGIRVVMITGDHKLTATAIGMRLGIIKSESEAIDGKEIDTLSDDELQELVKHVSVFARVSPEHKVRLVNSFRSNGEITAMTGDGVNDAPALKRADIGVAMGITGTDVSKEAADMILTDDNFASIVNAVEEGRTIYANIRKVVGFLLSCNIGEILLVFVASLFMGVMPLVPIHLLLINLATDAFPAFALGMEKREAGAMDVPPRDPKESIIDKTMLFTVLMQSAILGLAALASFAFAYYFEYAALPQEVRLASAQTFCFITLVVGELFRAYANRSEKVTIFRMKFFANSFLNKCVFVSLVFLFAAIYVPALNGIFKTVPLSFVDLDIALALAIIPVLGAEAAKRIAGRLSYRN
jgi:Ca2+-transporting ATPase